jgi:hypothetical protein
LADLARVLVLLLVGVAGARRVPSRWYMGFRLLLVAAVCHVLVDGWHFWEHYNLRDPVVAHTLLAVLKAVMLAGVITATPTQTTDITIWRR